MPKKEQEEEVYEEVIEFPANERYSAAPSLLSKNKGFVMPRWNVPFR